MTTIETFSLNTWDAVPDHMPYIEKLEQGSLLFFPQLAFELQSDEQRFLSPAFVDARAKNISYHPRTGLLKGACGSENELAAITTFIARFSQQAMQLVDTLFPHYRNHIQIARTSFRPVSIEGRKTSYRKDDTRLHVDAFPATPNQGQRIIRVFSNINPHGESRLWRVGESFEEAAKRFLPHIPPYSPLMARLLALLKVTKTYRAAYDHIMLHLHDSMKRDMRYQKTVQQLEVKFPPHSTWIVQTDQVSHAAMAGQHVLEQTFYLPVEAMQTPTHSPLKTLERLIGKKLV